MWAGTCASLCLSPFVFGPKGMVEVLAENYHNIWAKKKKSDLGSRGDSLMKSIRNAHCTKTVRGCACLCVCEWVDV